MIIYAGIDGTGTEDNAEYKKTFENSFVNRLQKVFPDKPFYTRGPALTGMTTLALAGIAYTHVVSHWKNESEDAVILAGYSRGGAAVIEVAQMLKKKGIPVECLILFDAVDRSTVVGHPVSDYLPEELGNYVPGKYDFCIGSNTEIASTVKQVIYAQRLRLRTRSRWTFQNCGFRVENKNMPFIHAQFYATHGGMGGVPWGKAENPYFDPPTPRETIWEYGEPIPTALTPQQDQAGAATVWAWAFPQIMRAKIECEVRLKQSNQSGAPVLPGNPNLPNPPGTPPLAPGEKLYIVKSGDWLSKIAITYYGDMKKWEKIYKHDWNRREIGNNPDFIKPGMRLVIPN